MIASAVPGYFMVMVETSSHPGGTDLARLTGPLLQDQANKAARKFESRGLDVRVVPFWPKPNGKML